MPKIGSQPNRQDKTYSTNAAANQQDDFQDYHQAGQLADQAVQETIIIQHSHYPDEMYLKKQSPRLFRVHPG